MQKYLKCTLQGETLQDTVVLQTAHARFSGYKSQGVKALRAVSLPRLLRNYFCEEGGLGASGPMVVATCISHINNRSEFCGELNASPKEQ